jgi:hypothetical protein
MSHQEQVPHSLASPDLSDRDEDWEISKFNYRPNIPWDDYTLLQMHRDNLNFVQWVPHKRKGPWRVRTCPGAPRWPPTDTPSPTLPQSPLRQLGFSNPNQVPRKRARFGFSDSEDNSSADMVRSPSPLSSRPPTKRAKLSEQSPESIQKNRAIVVSNGSMNDSPIIDDNTEATRRIVRAMKATATMMSQPYLEPIRLTAASSMRAQVQLKPQVVLLRIH